MWILIKAAGACCIMTGCILGGAALDRRVKKRWMVLQELQEVFVFLEREMTYHRSPVQEAFRNAAGKCTTELAQALLYAAEQVEGKRGQPFSEIWEEALQSRLPHGLFREEEMRLLCGTSHALVNTDTVIQRTLLEKYADRFRTMSAREAESCREKGALYQKLAAAAGIFLILLLL